MVTVSLRVLVARLSVFMVQLFTPNWIVSVLIGQTLLAGVLLGLITSRVWFSYVLFLVFLGGMLVIFRYVSRLAAEELLEGFPFYLLVGGGLVGALRVRIYRLAGLGGLSGDFLARDSSITLSIVKLFSSGGMKIYGFVVGYLLLALVCVANIAKSKFGPLRFLR